MIEEAKALYVSVDELYREMLPLLDLLERKTLGDHESAGLQQADTAYACRETVNLLKDLEKRINRVGKSAKTVCNFVMLQTQQKKLQTRRCTVSPKPRMYFKIPYKREQDPELSDEMQMFCGIPKETAEKELFRVHPPNFCSHMTELLGEGKEVPVDAANITDTELDLNIRKKEPV